MCIYIACDQAQIFIFRENRFVLSHDLRRIVIAVQEKQIVSEINGRFWIARQFLQDFVAKLCRFLVTAGEREITFALAHDLRILRDGGVLVCAVEPMFSNRQLVAFNR